MTYSAKTQTAISKYGKETCILAYKMNLRGNGARTIAAECARTIRTIRTTNQADAAINAGRELCETN